MMARFGLHILWANRYGVLSAGLAFGLYWATLAPTVMWYDMGEFALGSYVLGIGHNPGYPLYMILGKLFTLLPIGDVAYRVNLMSAAWGSAAVFLLFLIVKQITMNDFAGFVSAMTMAVGSTFWSNAVWAEAHTLNAFLSLLIVYLILLWRARRDFRTAYLAFFILGLGLGNHHLILMVAPAASLFLLLELGRRFQILFWKPVLLMALFVLLGSLVHVYLPIRALQGAVVTNGDPASVDGFFRMVLLAVQEGQAPDFSLSGMLDRSFVLWLFVRYDFPIPALFVSVLGFVALARNDRPFLAFTLVVVLLTALLIINFLIHDIYDYFIPIFLMLALWLGSGIAEMERLIKVAIGRFISASAREAASVTTIYAVRAVWLILPTALVIGNLSLLDRSGDYEAHDFAVNILAMVPPNGAIMSDHWTFYPILYQQIVGDPRPDVLVSNVLSSPTDELADWIERTLNSGQPIFVAEGLTDRVGEDLARFTFMTVAPGAIVVPPTDALPRPQYKDMLVRRKDVLLLTSKTPSLLIDEFPEGLEDDLTFEGRIRLVGLVPQFTLVPQGGSLWLEYYWEALDDLDTDLYMKVFFVDRWGHSPMKQGYPVWYQNHELGAQVFPTSEWAPGDKVRESYLSLVPRQVPPGTYYLFARLYRSDDQTQILQPSRDTGDQAVILGQVTVTERK